MQTAHDQVCSPRTRAQYRELAQATIARGIIARHSYKDAGVDIAAGNALVKAIGPLLRATARAGASAEAGGFGGLFDLAAAGFRDPLLVAGTDGVGTKLKIAFATGRHDTVGIDLVAMCVNDIIVHGAEPLLFLDYFATGRLDGAVAREVVAGIARGCQVAGWALSGGGTAGMPGRYGPGEYDLAGFALGAVERDRLLDGASVAPGDLVLGLASSGLHSNGFSLVRRIVEAEGLDYLAPAPFAPERTLGEALLEPTRIYVPACLAALGTGAIKALAHITGGGLVENVPRVLPDGLGARLDARAWPLAPVFSWLESAGGGIEADELARSFNCGIGMAVIVAPDRAAEAEAAFARAGETVYRIGVVFARADGDAGDGANGGPAVVIEGAEAAWRG